MRIGFDVDGVFANFNPGYIRLLNDIAGTDHSIYYEPQQWSYEADLGFTKEHVKEAWKRIEASDEFWYDLEPIEYPVGIPEDVYYITARPGRSSKGQTEDWLSHYINNPTVLISSHKGLCCVALDLEVYVDDRLENILDVQRTSPSTRAYLITRSYNVNGDVLRRADSVSSVLRTEGLIID